MPTPKIEATYNTEAECALLGSIILDNTVLPVAVDVVSHEDFFSQSNRIIFRKMVEVAEKKIAIDVITLADELSKEELLERVGGSSYLAGLTDGVPVGNYTAVKEYSRIIKEKSILRRLINASNNIISRAMQRNSAPTELLESAHAQLSEITQSFSGNGSRKI